MLAWVFIHCAQCSDSHIAPYLYSNNNVCESLEPNLFSLWPILFQEEKF